MSLTETYQSMDLGSIAIRAKYLRATCKFAFSSSDLTSRSEGNSLSQVLGSSTSDRGLPGVGLSFDYDSSSQNCFIK